MSSDWMQDQMLRDIQIKQIQLEQAIREDETKLAIARELGGLITSRPWESLTKRLKESFETETARLRDSYMGPWELGIRQGYLKALKMIMDTEPMDEAQLAKAQENIRINTEKLHNARALLAER